METPIKVKQNLVLEGIKWTWNTIRQWIVDRMFDYIVKVKTRETIVKCIQYNAKFYMIQKGSFSFSIFRKTELGAAKSKVSAMDLSEQAAFVAYPNIHNLKNYKRNGKPRREIKFF